MNFIFLHDILDMDIRRMEGPEISPSVERMIQRWGASTATASSTSRRISLPGRSPKADAARRVAEQEAARQAAEEEAARQAAEARSISPPFSLSRSPG